MGDSNPTVGEQQLLNKNLRFKLFIVRYNCDLGIPNCGLNICWLPESESVFSCEFSITY